MSKLTIRKVTTEAKLLLIGIPVFLWTIIPVYHMFLFAISPRDTATSGRLWPKDPTWQNFDHVFNQKHFYLNHFWQQLGNSLWIALAVGAITLVVATMAAFAISRLKVRGGRTVLNMALFTYFIPAAGRSSTHGRRHTTSVVPAGLRTADGAFTGRRGYLRAAAGLERVSVRLPAVIQGN